MLKPWNKFDASVELLTTALLAVAVLMFVDTVLLAPPPPPPNIVDSALALAKLNPIDELDVEDGITADVAVADGGVDASAVANGDVAVGAAAAVVGVAITCPVGETIDLVVSDDNDDGDDDDDDGGGGGGDWIEEFPRANEKALIELVLLVDTGTVAGALFSLLSVVDFSELEVNELPRSNLNVVDAVVAATAAGTGVLNEAGFVVGCTFMADAVPNGAAIPVVFATGVEDFVAAGFNVGVLLLAVGVSRSGIFPVVAAAGAAAPPPLPSTL